MTQAELIEWMAYDQLDPFGGYRQDLQTAHLLYVQYANKDQKISDYLPINPNPMTDEQYRAHQQAEHKAKLDAQMHRLITHLSKNEK